jgi:hypothetical protein
MKYGSVQPSWATCTDYVVLQFIHSLNQRFHIFPQRQHAAMDDGLIMGRTTWPLSPAWLLQT